MYSLPEGGEKVSCMMGFHIVWIEKTSFISVKLCDFLKHAERVTETSKTLTHTFGLAYLDLQENEDSFMLTSCLMLQVTTLLVTRNYGHEHQITDNTWTNPEILNIWICSCIIQQHTLIYDTVRKHKSLGHPYCN